MYFYIYTKLLPDRPPLNTMYFFQPFEDKFVFPSRMKVLLDYTFEKNKLIYYIYIYIYIIYIYIYIYICVCVCVYIIYIYIYIIYIYIYIYIHIYILGLSRCRSSGPSTEIIRPVIGPVNGIYLWATIDDSGQPRPMPCPKKFSFHVQKSKKKNTGNEHSHGISHFLTIAFNTLKHSLSSCINCVLVEMFFDNLSMAINFW